MYFFLVLILTLRALTVRADLVCLGWGVISPIVGVICHFAPATFHAAESKTVAAVEEAVQSAKDLVQFDLTHNPVTIGYNFLNETREGGLAQGGQYLGTIGKDYEGVTIGFAKGSANQLVQLYDLAHWNDISFCLITGAGHLASQLPPKSQKRAGVPGVNNAVKLVKGCMYGKSQLLSKPAFFSISSPNQQIGSTISNIATLLVPIGIEEKAATEAATAVDLVVPGSEDTTRVLKKIDEGQYGHHFANEAEAQSVAKNMQDETWVKENCAICAPSNVISARNERRRRPVELNRRGNVLTACCKLPSVIADPVVDLDTTFDEGEFSDGASEDDQANGPTYEPENYNGLTEDLLKPAPDYEQIIRDVSLDGDVEKLEQDLSDLSTGVVSWSPALRTSTNFDNMFTSLRQVFTSPETDPLYSALKIEEREGKLRLTTYSGWWMENPDPALKPFQDFVTNAVDQAIDTVGKLQKLTPEKLADLKGTMEFFYTAPSEEALTGTDPRGFHIDSGLMSFGAQDTPGLIIRNTVTGEASRSPVLKDTFQLFKGASWDLDAYLKSLPNGPTFHSVFGPEMAKSGRVSVVLSVFRKGAYI